MHTCVHREIRKGVNKGTPLKLLLVLPFDVMAGLVQMCARTHSHCFDKSVPHRQDFKGNFQAPSLFSPDKPEWERGGSQVEVETLWHQLQEMQMQLAVVESPSARALAAGQALTLFLSASIVEGILASLYSRRRRHQSIPRKKNQVIEEDPKSALACLEKNQEKVTVAIYL